MANLTGNERARYIQSMFARIARRYDLMNRIMTTGQDLRWRREVIHRAALPLGGRLLDLGAGTGGLAFEALSQCSTGYVVAADFSIEMMAVGQARLRHTPPGQVRLDWSAADACQLPFPDHIFDAVVSGFLMRNVTNVQQSLAEQYRVLKPGGRFVCLDTTPPPSTLLSPLIRVHLHMVIPTLGRLITGQEDAYTYLPDSTENFLEPEQLSARLAAVGFHDIGFHRLMFGTIAIHWGNRPVDQGRR